MIAWGLTLGLTFARGYYQTSFAATLAWPQMILAGILLGLLATVRPWSDWLTPFLALACGLILFGKEMAEALPGWAVRLSLGGFCAAVLALALPNWRPGLVGWGDLAAYLWLWLGLICLGVMIARSPGGRWIRHIADRVSQHQVVAAACLVFLYLAPYLLLGQESQLQIHDYLDSLENYILSSGYPNLFNSLAEIIPQKMGGQPRFIYPLPFNVASPYRFFDPLIIHIVNQFLMRGVALIGMLLLLNKLGHRLGLIVPGLATLASLGFALAAFFPDGGLYVAGMPLVTYLLWQIYDYKARILHWLALVAVIWYSHFTSTYLFFIPLLCVWLLWDMAKGHKLHLPLAFATALLSVEFVIWSYNMFFYMLLNPNFISQRVEFQPTILGWHEAIVKFLSLTWDGSYFYQVQHWLVFPNLAVFLFGCVVQVKKRLLKPALILFGIAIVLCLMAAFTYTGFYVKILAERFWIIKVFHLYRMVCINALLWPVLFFVCLLGLYNWGAGWRRFAWGLAMFQVVLHFYGGFLPASQGWVGWESLKSASPVYTRDSPYISYRNFYAKELFAEIARYIGRDQNSYRVGSVCLLPSVSLANGFYTVDGYLPIYPLEYKHRFRKVIAAELAKSEELRKEFDNKGIHCYLRPAELDLSSFQDKFSPLHGLDDLDLDLTSFKDLGGQYILSGLAINNSESRGMKLLKMFDHPHSAWRVYLYAVL
ncbi:hypothetical protein AAU61_01040 [Desulfocarbo indianensis]|nr:hypothetical protein AAU61_01040 [Desulfocarbo indianensis]